MEDAHTGVVGPLEAARALVARARAALAGEVPPAVAPGEDPWSRAAAEAAAGADPVAALDGAWARWRDLAREGVPGGEVAVRHLDDARRRLLFADLNRARRTPGEAEATARVARELGPPETWVRAFDRYTSQRLARAVLIVTWQCELRCTYCWIPKQDGRAMTAATAERAVDMLMSSEKEHVNLQFFGGEALLEYPVVRHAILHAEARARALGKTVDFVVSTNGWSLEGERLAWLAGHPVKLELSLDGDAWTQATFRRSNVEGEDSYTHSIAARAAAIRETGLPHEVIMVVQPRTASRLSRNFFHIVDLGFERVQINFALGIKWSPGHVQTFAEELFALAEEMTRRRAAGQRVTLVNLENAPMPVRLNGEIHVDHDGTVYGSNGFLNETDRKAEFAVGHLDDLHGFDRYWMDAPDNDFLLERTYPADVTANNLAVGRVMTSFLRWARERGLREVA